jgi:hypothetical protein
VPPAVVLLSAIAAGALLLAAAASRPVRAFGRFAAALAGLPLALAGLVTAYVFGEDSYRGNGISRWEAYRSPGGALGPMYVASVALLVACACALVSAALLRRERPLRMTAIVTALGALFLVAPTVVGFGTN